MGFLKAGPSFVLGLGFIVLLYFTQLDMDLHSLELLLVESIEQWSDLILPFPSSQILNPDIGRKTPELIVAHGYPVENHTVTTEDGYILTCFRIPFGKRNRSTERRGKPVALLVHGLLGSSSNWIMLHHKSLAYELVEQGYDVFLANSRGNSYSMEHTNLSSSNPEYWKFSWEHMGLYDLPAVIDYILELTGESQLFYIGHSQGTTQFFVMASMRPEYNAKIRLMSALAPVACAHRVRGAIWLYAPVVHLVSLIYGQDLIGHPVAPLFFLKFLNTYLPIICSSKTIAYYLCQNFFFMLFGFNPAQANLTALPAAVSTFPDSASYNQMAHYKQQQISKRFERFDLGRERNLAKYGTIIPTEFNISAITAPMALYWAYNDFIVHPLDVHEFGSKLPTGGLVRNFSVPFDLFSHMDYITGINASEWLYKPLVQLMDSYL